MLELVFFAFLSRVNICNYSIKFLSIHILKMYAMSVLMNNPLISIIIYLNCECDPIFFIYMNCLFYFCEPFRLTISVFHFLTH